MFFSKNLKLQKYVTTSLTLGGFLYLATDDEIQRRQQILFRAGKLFMMVQNEQVSSQKIQQEQQAQKLYELLSEAGGTFVKLGQMIATNTYLFPDAYVKALMPLLDNCPTTNYQVIKKQIEKELGRPVEEVFKYIDEKPVASASLAQVHRGILLNGDEVAIKIQHQKIRERASKDIKMVQMGLQILKTSLGYDYKWLANDIHESLLKELNFKIEVQNAEKCRQLFEDNPNIYIPKIYNQYTTEKLIIMEFIHAYKITEKDKLERDNLDKLTISNILNQCFSKQVFEHGFVHCDPHPGNILVRPIPQKYYTNWLMGWQAEYNAPQIVLLDHGIYRDINKETRMVFAKMWKGIILGDQKSNEEIAEYLKVDLDKIYYPEGGRELDSVPRIKLLRNTLAYKCFEAENAEEVFSEEKTKGMSASDIADKKICYDYAKRMHKACANALCESEDRNLFFLFKNNLYIRNIDIELGYEINNVNTLLDYACNLIDQEESEQQGYWSYYKKYLAKSVLYYAGYFY